MKKIIIPLLIFLFILTLILSVKDIKKDNFDGLLGQINNMVRNTPVFVPSEKTTYKVKRVIDGDTIELEDGQKVRYIGINTPETVDPRLPIQCFGKEASDENKKLVENKVVRLEKDISETDKYGRLLRYVYTDNIFINDYLVKNGFARASTFPPDVKFAQLFLTSEKEARTNNTGLWNQCPVR